MEKFKKSLDDLIYSWSKVNEELIKLSEEEQEFIKANYPLDNSFQQLLHRLIDWRTELD